MKHLISFVLAFVISLGAISVAIWHMLGPVSKSTDGLVLIVPQLDSDFDVPGELKRLELIRNETAFRWFMSFFAAGKSVVPGGYRLHPSMTSWAIVTKITDTPQFVWVSIREGLRKEQIGEIVGTHLGWTPEQEQEWNDFNSDSVEYREGVYFPDTYLLPTDEPVPLVAKRFLDNFNTKFAPYVDKFAAKNIKWTTALKIASLIEREAGGLSDMPVISGIIWNRLDKDMRLEIDATLQYIKGNSETGWWPRVVPADKYLESPYNTYRNKGLPPGPISNPGLATIDAVLNPVETDCIFYLHAPDRQMYCTVTYEEHLENIKTYLQ